jgi:uncharacterized NAD(P)/FAD-binding protein YdhS
MKSLGEPQLCTFSSKEKYDIAIVGSGVSCSYTVISYISLLLNQIPKQPLRLAIIDKDGVGWVGVPYGQRNGQHSLIISSLKEFLPQPELDNFKHWLNQNYQWVFDTAERGMGLLSSKWFDNHQPEMSAGDWDELFVPRYAFGLYLKGRISELLQQAQACGAIEYSLVTAEVTDLQQVDGLYQIEMDANEGRSSLMAQKVILAIGSPPNKNISFVDDSAQGLCYIDNMYEPSQSLNIDLIIKTLQNSHSPEQNQVLIIGSNASALETIYSLSNNIDAVKLINKFIVISNGGFPSRICPTVSTDVYEAQYLKALAKSPDLTAKDILEAVKQDVAMALAQNETVGSTYATISKRVIEALHLLSAAEQSLFVTKYGVEIGKHQRRAGSDYLNVVEQLMSAGKLDLIKGKFIKTSRLSNEQHGFEFLDASTQEKQVFSTPLRVVVNCAGFQDLTKSSSTLIENLIQRGICTPNDSNNGFYVNENFEANQNLYLVGPLVAGNINHKFKIWHAESCARIVGISQQLAEILVQNSGQIDKTLLQNSYNTAPAPTAPSLSNSLG